MDLSQIRRLVIVAMFSDDELFGQLALKGGNARSAFRRVTQLRNAERLCNCPPL
jgi:hypothetical protein